MKHMTFPLIILFAFALGCNEEPTYNADSGQFTFNMPLSFAKTTVGVQIDSVHVTITGPTNVSSALTISNDSLYATGTFTGLITGSYSISVLAFANHDTVATGSGNANVTPGQITTVDITLTLLAGGLTINIHWSVPQTIVFIKSISGIKQICTINTDSTNFTTLTSFTVDPSTLAKPSYSPDGNKLAVWVDTGSGINVWLMNSNGSNFHQVTSNNEAYVGDRVEFSSTSDKMYYRRTTGPGAASIWSIDTDGQNDGLYFDFPGNEYMIEFVGNSHLLFYVHGGGLYRTNNLTDLNSSLLVSGAQSPSVNSSITKMTYVGLGSTWDKLTISNIDASLPQVLKDEAGNFIVMTSFTNDEQSIVYGTNGLVKIINIDGSGYKIVTEGDDPMAKPN